MYLSYYPSVRLSICGKLILNLCMYISTVIRHDFMLNALPKFLLSYANIYYEIARKLCNFFLQNVLYINWLKIVSKIHTRNASKLCAGFRRTVLRGSRVCYSNPGYWNFCDTGPVLYNACRNRKWGCVRHLRKYLVVLFNTYCSKMFFHIWGYHPSALNIEGYRFHSVPPGICKTAGSNRLFYRVDMYRDRARCRLRCSWQSLGL